MINVTKTFLPEQEEYQRILAKAWSNEWITNRGELVEELEGELAERFSLPYVLAMANGTLPIQIAIQALGLRDEIITTPFSYVATTSSIVWQNCTPVFVDISPGLLTINSELIEQAITDKTTGILATHVFGNPCDVEKIELIAKKYNLKVIYDAAHCFDVSYKGQSVFGYGDVSTCSFHATKLFHTAEGGAAFTKSEGDYNKIFQAHNFGHRSTTHIQKLGINAKMSELHAALGLTILPHVERIRGLREKLVIAYRSNLANLPLEFLKIREGTLWNYAYFPLVFADEISLLRVLDLLSKHNIYPRRYFYPSLNTLEYVIGEKCTISESISTRVLCLPLHHGMTIGQVEEISHLIRLVIQ
jgi:dTDP-4-amino-4,6-dideoxygalactose transaminase